MTRSLPAVVVGIISVLSAFHGSSVAVTISGRCPQETVEDSQTVVTCEGISSIDTVVWHRTKGSVNTDAGQCDPLPADCYSVLPSIMDLSRPSSAISSMTITSTTRNLFGGATIRCLTKSGTTDTGSATCQIDVIYPAEVTSCSIEPVRTDDSWSLWGTCSISKVFSSMGRYSCGLWQSMETSGSEISVHRSTYTPTLDNGTTPYANGTCSYTTPLPADGATYSYNVTVSPGDTRVQAGSITVATPTHRPTTECKPSRGEYTPENDDLECTCTASDLGQPAGRLTGFRGNKRVANGDYGDVNLTLPGQTLVREDHGVIIRCVLDWATSDTQDKSSSYKAVVGYAPEVLWLSLDNVTRTLTVRESPTQSVSLQCLVAGRPVPDIRLLQDGQRELVRRSGGLVGDTVEASVSHDIPARCDNTAYYICLADNTVGNPARANITLNVLCSPRLAPEYVFQDPPTIDFDTEAVTLTFDLVGYPQPDRFSFVYLGKELNSSVPGRPARVDLLHMTCSQNPIPSRSTCLLTVTKVIIEDEGYYEAIVMNSEGREKFIFRLTANASGVNDTHEQQPFCADCGASSYDVAVGLGVTLAMVVAANVVVALLLWRRQWALPCAAKANRATRTPDREMPASTVGMKTFRDSTVPAVPDTSDAPSVGQYDALNMQEVGLRSPYAEIGYHGDRVVTRATDPTAFTLEGPVYKQQMTADPTYQN